MLYTTGPCLREKLYSGIPCLQLATALLASVLKCGSVKFDQTLKPVSHQHFGSRTPVCGDKFLRFVSKFCRKTANKITRSHGYRSVKTPFSAYCFLCDFSVIFGEHKVAVRKASLLQDMQGC